MKHSVKWWQVVGFLFTAVVGTGLHFLFDLTGGSVLAALISAVNESIWEHLKLLFFPMLLFSALQFWQEGHRVPNFLAVRAVSVLIGTGLIPILFYTYSGILGRNIDGVNITIFFVAAFAAFASDSFLRRQGALCGAWKQLLGLGILWVMAFVFIWATWNPVELPLWQDPITGTYGIQT